MASSTALSCFRSSSRRDDMLFLGALAAPDALAAVLVVGAAACLCCVVALPLGLFGFATGFSGCLGAVCFGAPEPTK